GAVTATTAQQVNCGGAAVGTFAADQAFSGGSTITHLDTIDTSKLQSGYPPAVFQSARVSGGSFYYLFVPYARHWPGQIALLFAETYWKAAGSRQFNVSVNGTQVLTNFDVFAQAGGKDVALDKYVGANTDANGYIKIQFSPVKDQPLISGLQVIPL